MKKMGFTRYAAMLALVAAFGCALHGAPVGAMPDGGGFPAGSFRARDFVMAQATNGADPQRNCQTLRTCNFSKGGSFRGCISTYSCKMCRFVPGKCSVGATTGHCYRQVCEWSGS